MSPDRKVLRRSHQPGQAAFRAILPEDIVWKAVPAFPPSARLAIVVGEPARPGAYMVGAREHRDLTGTDTNL